MGHAQFEEIAFVLILQRICAKVIMLFCQKWCDRPFRLHGSEATCTICDACAQKMVAANMEIAGVQISQYQKLRQNHSSVNTVWGIYLKKLMRDASGIIPNKLEVI